MIRARSPTSPGRAVKLVDQMFGERGRRIFDAVEIEAFLAAARRHDVGEAVGFQRFGLPVHVERTIVIGLAHDQVVGAGIVGRLVAAVIIGDKIAGRLLVGLLGARFQQRVFGQLLGEEGIELEVAELKQLDRLAQLRRQDQLLRLADA